MKLALDTLYGDIDSNGLSSNFNYQVSGAGLMSNTVRSFQQSNDVEFDVKEDPRGYIADVDEKFYLADCEVETLRRAAVQRKMPFDPSRRHYTRAELQRYGLVREGYTQEELRARGIGTGAVTSFDQLAVEAPELLPVETPFGKGIRKWQLPIDMGPLRIFQTVLPPGTHVSRHVHPPHSEEAPGGCVRIVSRGSVTYNGRRFGPGDWFFAPNGEPYEFTTDPEVETVFFYKYRFFAEERGNRFSHPHAVDE